MGDRQHRGRYACRATVPAMAILLGATVACGSTATMSTATTPPSAAPSQAGCGDPVAEWVSSEAPLAMTASFPGEVRVGTEELVRGTVSVTNRSEGHLHGTSAAQPDISLARDGKVVALPVGLRLVAVVIDLAPGASRTFEAVASLRPCDAGVGTQSRLPPGSYQLFASQQFDLGDPAGSDRQKLLVRGGPWTLTLV